MCVRAFFLISHLIILHCREVIMYYHCDWGGTDDDVLPCCVTTTLCVLLPVWDGGEDWWYCSK